MEMILDLIRTMIPARVRTRIGPWYHFLLAFAAALRYGFPARRLKMIGVTGTKGKTTTVHLLHEIFSSAGVRTASLSSLRFRIADLEQKNETKMTMPGRFFVQRFLRDAARADCSHAVIEVTSQGIAQSRHRFIPFAAGVFTNVAPEHIEAHGGFEQYLRAKLDLFWRMSRDAVAIMNRDDPSAARFAAATAAHRAWYGHDAIAVNGKIWKIADRDIGAEGIAFEMGRVSVRSPLSGEFNFYNILAACATALALNIALEHIAAGVSRFAGAPGRMEFVRYHPVAVVVDYAHTPDSLRAVYEALKKRIGVGAGQPRLICVLGSAGGGRDQWKRPVFGEIASRYCDESFLTNEDPYDEDPAAIIDAVAEGFLAGARRTKVPDRREAIRRALQTASSGDIVVITGKGAEPWLMEAGGKRVPWDDRAVAREEADKLF